MKPAIHTKTDVRAWLTKWRLLWIPPVLGLLAWIFYRPLLWAERFAADHILFCPFHELTGLYCPGCGGTRSLTALIHGQVLLSVHENPAVIVLVLTAVLLYIEKVCGLFGRPVRIVPRRLAFWLTGFGLLAVWDVARHFVPALMPILPVN